MKTVMFECKRELTVRPGVKHDLQAVRFLVDLDLAAGERPTEVALLRLAGQLCDTGLVSANLGIVAGELIGCIGFLCPIVSHLGFQPLDFRGRQAGAAVQGLVLPVVGINGPHLFLVRLQLFKPGLEFLQGLGIVGADNVLVHDFDSFR